MSLLSTARNCSTLNAATWAEVSAATSALSRDAMSAVVTARI